MSTKIGFVLTANAMTPLASTRISVLNMLPYLAAEGFEPCVLWQPGIDDDSPDLSLSGVFDKALAEGVRIVYFQKIFTSSAVALARQLSKAGVRTVWGVCDFVRLGMVHATDATIAVTEHLRSLYPAELQAKIHVVHDGIENPQACKTDWGSHGASRSRPLRAVLVTAWALPALPLIGTPPPWLEVCIVGRYPPGIAALHERIQRVPWDPVDVYRQLLAADVGIIPIETGEQGLPGWNDKSENRLTLKMAAALPVVATPIPSYRPVMEHGANGLFATTPEEWLECLEALREPAARRQMGEQARKSVLESYSMERQSRRLISVLRQLLSSPQEAEPCSSPA